ncbi:MAG: transporter substrate-binding domain-containing protein [Rubellimicrobium sp.]|nr:transporter substrate-binding domain-containing protein [Rubellimicrobium sp.]
MRKATGRSPMTLAAAMVAGLGTASPAAEGEGGTLAQVQAEGRLACGVNAGLAGFATVDANGVWSGFEVEFCRALSAAVLGDPALVDFLPLPVNDRYADLVQGAADVVARGGAWSIGPDVVRDVDLVATSYYDQLGFLLPVELGVSSPKELGQATICVLGDLTTAAALDDYFRAAAITYQPLSAQTDAEARTLYLADECDAYARPAAELHAVRATFELPLAHVIVTDPASRVPSGPVVREGDDRWANVVRWTYMALLAGEELGITSANVREMAATASTNPEVNRLLGTEGDIGTLLGLAQDWAVNALAAGGNYGEIFERNIGENTPIGLARGLNALWTRGGLQYAPPFR